MSITSIELKLTCGFVFLQDPVSSNVDTRKQIEIKLHNLCIGNIIFINIVFLAIIYDYFLLIVKICYAYRMFFFDIAFISQLNSLKRPIFSILLQLLKADFHDKANGYIGQVLLPQYVERPVQTAAR